MIMNPPGYKPPPLVLERIRLIMMFCFVACEQQTHFQARRFEA